MVESQHTQQRDSVALCQDIPPDLSPKLCAVAEEPGAVRAGWEENEKLVMQLQRVGESDAPGIMASLWERNRGLIRQTVHRVTGLSERDDGYEDMLQQAYFGFHSAAYTYEQGRGGKFSSFAVQRIEWELIRYHEQNGYTTRIPGYMRRRLRDCMEKRKQMEAESGHSVSYEAALRAMGFSSAAIASTLSAFRKLETASLDTPNGEVEDGASLMELLVADGDLEEAVLGQEWHRELHKILFAALREIPETEREIIVRRYFSGVSFDLQAQELGVTRQTIGDRAHKGYQAIRAGKYGPQLAEFMPSESKAERAKRLIRRTRAAVERLKLTEEEKGLLIL